MKHQHSLGTHEAVETLLVSDGSTAKHVLHRAMLLSYPIPSAVPFPVSFKPCMFGFPACAFTYLIHRVSIFHVQYRLFACMTQRFQYGSSRLVPQMAAKVRTLDGPRRCPGFLVDDSEWHLPKNTPHIHQIRLCYKYLSSSRDALY